MDAAALLRLRSPGSAGGPGRGRLLPLRAPGGADAAAILSRRGKKIPEPPLHTGRLLRPRRCCGSEPHGPTRTRPAGDGARPRGTPKPTSPKRTAPDTFPVPAASEMPPGEFLGEAVPYIPGYFYLVQPQGGSGARARHSRVWGTESPGGLGESPGLGIRANPCTGGWFSRGRSSAGVTSLGRFKKPRGCGTWECGSVRTWGSFPASTRTPTASFPWPRLEAGDTQKKAFSILVWLIQGAPKHPVSRSSGVTGWAHTVPAEFPSLPSFLRQTGIYPAPRPSCSGIHMTEIQQHLLRAARI